MVNRGYGFEYQISWALKHLSEKYDIFYQKLVDTTNLSGTFCPVCKKWNKSNLIIPKSIADFIVMSDGITIFIETKTTYNKTSFPLANIKDHQRNWGLQIDSFKGHLYYFLIHFKYNKFVYAIRATKLEDIVIKLKRKSVPVKVFNDDSRFIKIEKDDSNNWDLEPLLGDEIGRSL